MTSANHHAGCGARTPRARSTERTPIPLSVRRKLAESGQSLSAEQWHRLPAAARHRLERMPSETITDKRTFATLVDWLRLTFITPGRVTQRRTLPPQGTWPWHLDQAPDHVARALARFPLDWTTLDVDQRFGLVEASTASDPDALTRYIGELLALADQADQSVVA